MPQGERGALMVPSVFQRTGGVKLKTFLTTQVAYICVFLRHSIIAWWLLVFFTLMEVSYQLQGSIECQFIGFGGELEGPIWVMFSKRFLRLVRQKDVENTPVECRTSVCPKLQSQQRLNDLDYTSLVPQWSPIRSLNLFWRFCVFSQIRPVWDCHRTAAPLTPSQPPLAVLKAVLWQSHGSHLGIVFVLLDQLTLLWFKEYPQKGFRGS